MNTSHHILKQLAADRAIELRREVTPRRVPRLTRARRRFRPLRAIAQAHEAARPSTAPEES